MCGIAGCVDWHKDLDTERGILEAMGETLVCRGPDATDTWTANHCGFTHRRLIVIDPEGGGQPMTRTVAGHQYTITYNGELYNMDELRADLKSCGHVIQSRSDTELLLLSYVEWGLACVEHFNGIFAFGIWDEAKQTLFLARDRLGVKPLFYAKRDDVFVFGSEIKALLTHPQIPAQVDMEGLAELLFVGPARTPGHAIFKGIYDLRPGHFLLYSKEGLTVKPYWQLESKEHEEDYDATVSRVRELFSDAVSRQLVSDVPIATLLSGGLDSSAVTAIAAKTLKEQQRGPLHTFSVDFYGADQYFESNSFQTSRDAPWVKRVSDYVGTIHHNVLFDTPDLIEHLTRPMLARDLPGMADIDTSLYLFSREIKKTATVALSGEAADEVFGGYPWFHRDEALFDNTFPWSRRLSLRADVVSPELMAQIQPQAYVQRRYEEALNEVPRLPGESTRDARIREVFYLNITRFLTTLLERKDRMSMAAGLEIRVPFCDHRLVEYVWNIPWSMKNRNQVAKSILRDAVSDMLPQDVVYRKKTPYPSTPNPAYLHAVRDWLQGILQDETSPILPLLNVPSVKDMIAKSAQKVEHIPWFGQIMAVPQMFDYLIQIDTWLRTYNVSITS